MITNYIVTGMTCGNCVKHVTEEVEEIDGVTGVQIELDGGRMALTSEDKIDFEAVKAAVAEAGDYEVVEAG